MRSKYGQVCPKHPELHGRRYIPSNGCIKCHNELTKSNHRKRKEKLDELIAAAIEVRNSSYRLSAALEALGHAVQLDT